MAIAVVGGARDQRVSVSVETWTIRKQVSPLRVACSFIFHNLPAGASGDRSGVGARSSISPMILGGSFKLSYYAYG